MKKENIKVGENDQCVFMQILLNINNMNCASAFGEKHNKINEIINYINKENKDES